MLSYVSRPAGAGGGSFTPDDWTEITSGTLRDPSGDMTSFTHSSGSGWNPVWAAGSGRRDDFDNAPCMWTTLEDLGHPDFDWDTYGIDLLITTSLSAMNATSPFNHGFAVAVVDSTFTSGQGVGVTTRSATDLNTGQMSGSGVGLAAFDNDLIGIAVELRKYEETNGTANVTLDHIRWETGTLRGHGQWDGSGAGSEMFTDSADALRIAVYAVYDTTSSRPITSYNGRVYYRITRLRARESAAEILALG